MRPELRENIRQSYANQCGYCGVHEFDVGAVLTIDHFRPISRGGDDSVANLVYCCVACNTFKGDFWRPRALQRLLHPRRDTVSLHLLENDEGILNGLTPTGIFHITKLHLNREELVESRRRRRRIVMRQAEREALLTHLNSLEAQIREIKEIIERLGEV
jgi:HNH endonuclease